MSADEIFPESVKVKSLYKAIKLLNYFDFEHPQRGISELAQLSGMLKSSVYNIISTFEECAIIEKDCKTNRYHLGLKILELSNVLSRDDVFRQIIKPYMDQIAQKTGEVVFLATPYGTKIIYREVAYPNICISTRIIKGVTAPMYCTSIGKAILAYQDQEFIQRVIDEGLKSFTPNTITEPSIFRMELEKIRVQGYALDNMEHEYGIKCVGVPIMNEDGTLIGALSISGPSLRFEDKKIQEYFYLLKETAGMIKSRI